MKDRHLLIVAAIAAAQAAATFQLGGLQRHVLGDGGAAYVALSSPLQVPAVAGRAKDSHGLANAAGLAADIPGARPELHAEVPFPPPPCAVFGAHRWLPRTPRPPPPG